MKLKKKTWRKSRNICITIVGRVEEHGNSGRFYPAIPAEYIGKKAHLTIIDDDEGDYELIEENKKRG
jgi:putative transposon-encoded protein